MTDRVTEAFTALSRVDPPLVWIDVAERVAAEDDAPVDVAVAALAGAPRPHGSRRRAAIAFVAAAVVVAVTVAGVRGVAHRERREAPAASSGPSPTSAPPTTAVVSPTSRIFPVTTWTGRAYLVWGGEAGANEPSAARADGWSYDPATGETTSIPPAPIAPRSRAAGVWTGTELIVCCGEGASDGSKTDDAAAYNPATRAWRRIADPPAAAGRGFPTAVWTGNEMVVIFAPDNGPSSAFAYKPATDHWRTLADPPASLTSHPHAVWTGLYVVVWGPPPGDASTPDAGYRYDPTTDAWTALPPLPDALATNAGSIVWTGNELVVYGVTTDGLRGTGARRMLRDGDWQPLDTGVQPTWGGTPGSQTLLWDDASHQIVVWPVNGTSGGAAAPPLVSFDPDHGGAWKELQGRPEVGYAPELTIGDGYVLQPDRAHPVVARVQ